jgi:hypothetical protein
MLRPSDQTDVSVDDRFALHSQGIKGCARWCQLAVSVLATRNLIIQQCDAGIGGLGTSLLALSRV